MHIPKIPLKEVPEYVKLIIPAGTYKAKIVDVQKPRALQSKSYIFSVGFVMEIPFEEGPRKVWQYYAGYPATTSMLWRNRKLWIGTEVEVQIRIKQFEERIFNDATIIWPEEST